MADFFARPGLLVTAPLIYWVLLNLLRQQQTSAGWQQFLPINLAPRLLSSVPQQSVYLLPLKGLVLLVSCLLSLALAGVGLVFTASQVPSQEHQLVIVQHLSPSGAASGLAQEQLRLSQQAVLPLLNKRQQGQTALILYAATSHLASPLTRDITTIKQLFGLVHPSVMPQAGHQPVPAFQLAANLAVAVPQPQPGQLVWLWLTAKVPEGEALADLLTYLPAGADLYVVWLGAAADFAYQQARLQELGVQLLEPAEVARQLEWINSYVVSQRLANVAGLSWFQELSHWPFLAALLLLLWHYWQQPGSDWVLGQVRRLASKRLSWWCGWVGVFVLSGSLAAPLQAAAWQNQTYRAWQALQAGDLTQAQELVKAQNLAKSIEIQAHLAFAQGQQAQETSTALAYYAQAASLFQQLAAADLTSGLDTATTAIIIQAAKTPTYSNLVARYNWGTALLLQQQFTLAVAVLQTAQEIVTHLSLDMPEVCLNLTLAQELEAGRNPTLLELHQACVDPAKNSLAATEQATSTAGKDPASNSQDSVIKADVLPEQAETSTAGQQENFTSKQHQPQQWQAQPSSSNNAGLNSVQQQQLHSLAEDPWQLLRNRFAYEAQGQP